MERAIEPASDQEALTQLTHCFEGFFSSGVLATGNYLTLAHDAGDVVAPSRRDAARPAASGVLDHSGDAIVGFVQDLLNLCAELCQRVDPILVVASQRTSSTNDADVIGRAVNRPPLDFRVPELRRGVDTPGPEGREVTAYDIRARGQSLTPR
jgi:hypothetical protein